MSPRQFDVVIIGAGPAGLAAAAVVAAAGSSCVAIDRMGPGGQLMNLGTLHGMPDLEPGAMGPDLLASLAEKAMDAGAELAVDDVTRVLTGEGFLVEALDETYAATAVVVATGLTPGTTRVPDERRFEGQGLSHCASCDGPLYQALPVVVAGDDLWSLTEAIELAATASTVTLVSAGQIEAPPEVLAAWAALSNVEHVHGRIVGLEGATALQSVQVDASGGSRRVPARGLFLYAGREPDLSAIAEVVPLTPGIFFAGDVRSDRKSNLVEAIADGSDAGHNALAHVRARRA